MDRRHVRPYRQMNSRLVASPVGIVAGETNHREPFYFNKILNGTKPADLPVELPAQINLLVNLRTAKWLGLEVPLSLLIRADELIE